MHRFGRYMLPLAMCSIVAAPAVASVLPPPPPYVFDAQPALTDAAGKDVGTIARFFADDATASLNGQRIASTKAAWLAWWGSDRRHHFGRTIGYSAGWKGDGALLVVEQFDTQDNNATPPPRGDPRPIARAIFYRFGADGLIHAVDIDEVDSFFVSGGR